MRVRLDCSEALSGEVSYLKNKFLYQTVKSRMMWTRPSTASCATVNGWYGTHRVWIWVEPPHILTVASNLSIPVDGYNVFPYTSPIRINGYPQVKLTKFATRRLEHYIVIKYNLQ